MLGRRSWTLIAYCSALFAQCAAGQTLQKSMSSDEMRGIHARMDANRDKLVSIDEGMQYVQTLRSRMTLAPALEIIRNVDSDKDGHVSHAEFTTELKVLKYDEEEKEQLSSMFMSFDDDADELLSQAEASVLFSWMFKSRKLDSDGDGELTLKEFSKVAAPKTKGAPDEVKKTSKAEGMQIFRKLDADGDKRLSPKEVFVYESGIYAGQEALQKLFQVVDTDADKHLSADELVEARGSREFLGTNAFYHLKDWISKTEL